MTATQQGVVSQRSEMMAEIVASREAQLAEEMKEGGVDIATLERGDSELVMPDGTDQAEWDKLDPDARRALIEADRQRQETESQGVEPADGVTEPPQKVKIKVDGKEMEVDLQAVIDAGTKALQKESAADRRLEEAARVRQEADAILQSARTAAQNQDAQTAPPAGGPPVIERLTDDGFISAAKAIQYGTEQEAVAALKTLVSQAASSGQDDSLTREQVAEFLDFREATKWANDEFKDILGDPKLKSLFVQEEKRLRAAGDTRPYREIYTEIGNGMREWKSGLNPKPAAPADRQQRKASVVTIQSASGRVPAPAQPKEPSTSDVIAQMRAARKQG